MSDKPSLIKGDYSMEVSGSNINKLILEVVDDHVVEDPKDNY